MSLLERFNFDVPLRVRRDGQSYCENGQVEEIHLESADRVEATVLGGDEYVVVLERRWPGVAARCTCPYFQSGPKICKHIWATICAGDAEGIFELWELTPQDHLIPEAVFAPDKAESSDEDDPDNGEDREEEDDEDEQPEDEVRGGPINERRIRTETKAPPAKADWRKHLSDLREELSAETFAAPRWPAGQELFYVVDVQGTLEGRGLLIEVAYREKKKDGGWTRLKTETVLPSAVSSLPRQADREILSLMMGPENLYRNWAPASSAGNGGYYLREGQVIPLMRMMCGTGRCLLRPRADGPELEPAPLQWDDGPPWQFRLEVKQAADEGRYQVQGWLHRDQDAMPLSEPTLVVSGGLVFTSDRVARLNDGGAFPWIVMLREHPALSIPLGHADELLRRLLDVPRLPPLQLPEELRPEQVAPTPRFRIRLDKPSRNRFNAGLRIEANVAFDYDGLILPAEEPGSGVYEPERKRMVIRNADLEEQALSFLHSLGFRPSFDAVDGRVLELSPSAAPQAIRRLIEQQWHVEAEGKLYRQPGKMNVEISSGIDWFELHGSADFDGQNVALPRLLSALGKGERTIVLDDGSMGVLPEQWLKQYGALASMGEAEGDHLRFSRTQVALLDALLASQPEASCDEVFEKARRQLLQFEGVTAADAPAGFTGVLRPYQREGLGWMKFLRDFSFGGCLADDMGLGKTVQVLALLEERRAPGAEPAASSNGTEAKPGPSLVVAPRSLIFNWIEEATRFAPKLRVLDYTGSLRPKSLEVLKEYDLILTTYGTVRNDAPMLRDLRFDYLILDEAQAIKNAASGSAKAARLLQGNHRLALSGTPVQNHLGELWSLFEFLNPGMLGSARSFEAAGGGTRVVEPETRGLLSRALRPFILRRTKGQVARDLPERIEQTIHCELDPDQRKMYDELREHYRLSLMARVEAEGINKSKIQILEALLRLRQAACHPGLIDKTKTGLGSAKLDALLPQLAEVNDGNHKALVFSQFTSMLAIVRDRLDKANVPYEYLDGRTRDRAERVQRFQTDENCKLFLISLKAGGLGLNLTAAEYVFLLDPWWNPAVEAQAIDRAHRIGQARKVFAYRLIAKDTVEDKVLQLQATKRELADAIINAENSVISRLGKEELQLLLS